MTSNTRALRARIKCNKNEQQAYQHGYGFDFVRQHSIFGIHGIPISALDKLVQVKKDLGCDLIVISDVSYLYDSWYHSCVVVQGAISFTDKQYMAHRLRFPTNVNLQHHIENFLSE